MIERLPLGDGWTAWSLFALRSGGFPAHWPLRLASLRLARTIDEQLEAAADRRTGRFGGGEVGQVGATRVRSASDAGLVRVHEEAERLLHRELAALAGEERFQEALLWQNRVLLPNTVKPYIAGVELPPTSEVRRRARILASYLQRYCLKSESIGFFGPVAWGRIRGDYKPPRLRIGPQLIARRKTYFEHWCIQAFADHVARVPEIRRCLPPRLNPTVRLTGKTLRVASGQAWQLSPLVALLLDACTGERTAAELLTSVREDLGLAVAEEARLYRLLVRFAERGWILWSLEIPAITDSQAFLLAALARLPEPAGRESALSALRTLEDRRLQVEASAGRPAELAQALGALESSFSSITGMPATRRSGEMYAGRTCVYEDCVRDCYLRLDQAFVNRIAPPLRLLLQSARWHTHNIARLFSARLATAYGRCRDRLGDARVPFGTLYREVAPAFAEVSEAARDELTGRWLEVLGDAGAGHARPTAHYSTQALHEAAMSAFSAPHPGWPAARFHSVDLQLVAREIDLARGDYKIVVGDFHPAWNTLVMTASFFANEHPAPGDLLEMLAVDLPADHLEIVSPEASRMSSMGWKLEMLRPRRYDLEVGTVPSVLPPSRVLRVGDLSVDDFGGCLRVVAEGKGKSWDPIQVFDRALRFAAADSFALLPARAFTPRIEVDDVILSRRSWRFDTSAVSWLKERSGLSQFVGARQWARLHGLPRYSFVKVTGERKPFFVDLTSLVFVDCMAARARKREEFVVTEMTPDPSRLLLRDHAGRHYASEVRLVVVDAIAWRPRQ